jgi:ribosomal protein L7/L12
MEPGFLLLATAVFTVAFAFSRWRMNRSTPSGERLTPNKQVRSLTNLGLKDSKNFIDSLAETKQDPILGKDIPTELKANLRNLVGQNQKIQAIKRLRTYTGWGLKESKAYTDRP